MSDTKSTCYSLFLASSELAVVKFVGDRYAWAYPLWNAIDDDGWVRMTESEAWEWMEAVDSDDVKFPLASPEFSDKLQAFYDSII